ncbi:MAG: site-specific integrase [Nitrososphaeraceae archaeon]
MGSNPIPSIKPSVRRITENNKKKSPSINIRKNIDSSPKEGMRDLYDRENKLLYWIKRAESDLEGPDKTDVLKLIEYLQDQRKASLWIIRYITALISMRKQITKPFRNAKKNDIRQLINWMDNKEYKASTIEKFRIILKSFYKIVYGNNKKYPKAVDWFPVSIGKERLSKEKAIDLAECSQKNIVTKNFARPIRYNNLKTG